MILAEKIVQERKKNGWSQEDLADKLGVSRQSVSKWESAQSVPDLQRILEMSKLFEVSTDYLLKDEVEDRPMEQLTEESGKELRRVSMEEANAFLQDTRTFAGKISIGCLISIHCPVPLLVIMALQKAGVIPLGEDPAGGLGIIILLAIVALSLVFFISAGIAYAKWDWLEKEIFDTEYGVDGLVRSKSEKFKSTYVRAITMGTIIMIFGVIVFLAGAVVDENNEALHMGLCGLMLAAIAIGVFRIVYAGIITDGYDKLLQEGDYSKEEKSNTLLKAITPLYWMVATAIYLAWSFLSERWDITWIVWAIAGVLYGGISVLLKTLHQSKTRH
ncbi:MAG: helix-turn-helix transcriptional regulator [Clostridiales bacterium]|nr:helix-turn-helix transcriptional regulator [Clostridiales bacterium]